MSTVVVGTIQSNSTSPPTFNNTNGTEIGTLCRAFVNFNGTGTVAIRASFNVSSITDNGTGDYTVNFATAMSDANYAVAVSGSITGGTLRLANVSGDSSPTTTSRRVTSANSSFAAIDLDYYYAAFFR
jgi:hypothetical protein